MKKLVVILMAMVMIVLTISAGVAETIPNNYSEAMKLLEEYAVNQGYEKCKNEDIIDGTYYYCGLLNRRVFEHDTGISCTVDNWFSYSLNNKDWHISEMSNKQIGEIEGCRVYLCDAKTDDPAMYRNCDHMVILWMMYED